MGASVLSGSAPGVSSGFGSTVDLEHRCSCVGGTDVAAPNRRGPAGGVTTKGAGKRGSSVCGCRDIIAPCADSDSMRDLAAAGTGRASNPPKYSACRATCVATADGGVCCQLVECQTGCACCRLGRIAPSSPTAEPCVAAGSVRLRGGRNA